VQTEQRVSNKRDWSNLMKLLSLLFAKPSEQDRIWVLENSLEVCVPNWGGEVGAATDHGSNFAMQTAPSFKSIEFV